MTQDQLMLLGDEAVAMGAIHAGISAAYAYPGTPATEIQEAIQKYAGAHPADDIKCKWSINEKVAYEESLGASMVGLRAIVSFKHVGLNVAADPFMSSMITGAGGGLVVVPADDPGMHSSQNEQDSRFYAAFAQFPCLEPVNAQEAYDMTREAFDLSEKLQLPVMVRLVTRVSHTRSLVRFSPPRPKNKLNPSADSKKWTVLPNNARESYQGLLNKQSEIVSWSETLPFNKMHIEKGSSTGVIAGGLGYSYLMECLDEGAAGKFSYLRIASYPLPDQKITEFLKNISTLIIIEEGYPLIERSIWKYIAASGHKIDVKGKLTGAVPQAGELTADSVRKALGLADLSHQGSSPSDVVRPRPPQLCKGCPHIDTFNAVNKALEDKTDKLVFSDIGCYTLGYYPPFKAIHSCVCMGASVSMAKAAGENGLKYAVAVLGDSTFNHSGMTPLLEGIKYNSPFVTIIVDNGTTAMTGGQDTICTGEDIEKLILGMGLPREHLRIIEALPKNLETNAKIIREECEYNGPSVIIARRKCLQVK